MDVDLMVEALDGSESLDLRNVWTVNKLNVSPDSIATTYDTRRWSHLEDVCIPSVDGEVRILIGSNVPEAFWVLEERRGQRGEPYAIRSPLGWTVFGPMELAMACRDECSVNLIRKGNIESEDDARLQKQVLKFWETDFGDSISDHNTGMSVEDKRALQLMEETVELLDGHYQLGLPWRRSSPGLQDKRGVALKRLEYLKRKFQKDPELFERYKTSIHEYIQKGYAKRVPDVDIDQHANVIFYIPHHAVLNPNKPGKVRVVFDCTARCNGTSLNDGLLSGPDLTNNLVGVLTRFREEPVALVADIESMFHQVRVRPEDHNALRFLWWADDDLSKEPVDFCMQVHLFGSTSSPSCASFCLRKTADDNLNEFDEKVITAVKRNFYVDDCLISLPTVEAARKMVSDLSVLLSKGGFHLTKWLSNRKEVIYGIPGSERAKSILDLDLDDELPIERTLGVQWRVEQDAFTFKMVQKEKPMTRRGILSTTSSVFDPLGLVAPAILPAKLIMQDLCRQNVGWDDEIGEMEKERWMKWLSELPALSEVSVSRCIKPEGFGEIKTTQLHHFSDASQVAYGAVSYVRLVNRDDKIHCAFLLGKSRLAPIKPMTVPRLELCAAVVAVQMEQFLRRELDLTIDESIFWTDSTSVLRYIRNESSRFHTFVANRTAIIRDGSSPSQWRYVNTQLNPADDSSRGLSPKEMVKNRRWLNGPEFLWSHNEKEWPEEPQIPSDADDLEVKKSTYHITAIQTADEGNSKGLDALINYYSSWHRLKRAVTWLLRFKAYLAEKRRKRLLGPDEPRDEPSANLSLEELKVSERRLLMYVQGQEFRRELTLLRNANSKSDERRRTNVSVNLGTLNKLCPFIDEEGMLRVGGRLQNAPIEHDERHQIILPERHKLTDMIVGETHELLGHAGREHVLSNTRQLYWIVSGRAAIRRVLGNCFHCKRQGARCLEQKMADLPADRVSPDEPPFTNVGVDLFGPILVKQRRSQVKRYGCVFTCLTSRAIHIEIAESLDTDTFLNALRRFVNRRGNPKIIRSDNGTNFKAGERELREAVAQWNGEVISDYLHQRNIRWIFNPPAASHMGGVWERMIQSIKKVFRNLVKDQMLTDELLRTLVVEVEGILNSRPLTSVSDLPNDLDALTPNHLLLLRSNPNVPPGVFSKSDSYCKRRWRQVQYMANLFWKRWLKEYLPLLQERKRWTNEQRSLQKGDLVLVAEENVHQSQWPLARVTEVCVGRDGRVRSAKIKTRSTTLWRAITKLCFLEQSNEQKEGMSQ